MKRLPTTVITLALAGLVTVTPVLADTVPAPPPPATPESSKSSSQRTQDNGGRDHTGTIVKVVACVLGSGIVELGKPVPIKKMSKRQWRRYRVELARWNRARFEWGIGCGLASPVGGAALIAVDDFVSRFVTREVPIRRTPRQEQMLFCRDGSSPCPDLSGPDPDLYGPR